RPAGRTTRGFRKRRTHVSPLVSPAPGRAPSPLQRRLGYEGFRPCGRHQTKWSAAAGRRRRARRAWRRPSGEGCPLREQRAPVAASAPSGTPGEPPGWRAAPPRAVEQLPCSRVKGAPLLARVKQATRQEDLRRITHGRTPAVAEAENLTAFLRPADPDRCF